MPKRNVRAGLVLENVEGALSATQTIDVDGLSGDGLALLYGALRHGSVPRVGQGASGVPNLSVIGHTVRPNGTSGARVTVRYGVPGGPGAASRQLGATTVRISTETISEDTIRDIDGNLMFTKYVSRLRIGLSGSSVTTTTQYHRVAVERPTFAVIISRIERTNAFATSTSYTGKVNSRAWQGKSAKNWLMRVDSQEIDDDLHQVNYNAVFNPDTWLAEIRHVQGGIIPSDIRENNGIEFRDVYETIDYNALRLPSIL